MAHCIPIYSTYVYGQRLFLYLFGGCPVLLFVVLLPVLCCFVVVAPSWLTQVTYKDFNALSSYQLVRTEGQKAKRNEKAKLD